MTQSPPVPDCLFCKIVAGQIPADVVMRTDTVLAFRDINPKAPVHVLVIPHEHYADVGGLAEAGDLLAQMAAVAREIGEQESPGGWRWIFNVGPDGGQEVFHAHGHVLGGQRLGPMLS